MILTPPFLNRRRFLTGTAALGAAAAFGLPARAQSPLTVGFIYVGPRDDFGYNQAHAEGAAAVKAMAGVTVVEEENVAETIDVQKSMESMINLDGATLIFPTSFGYFNPHILELAPKYPDVRFQHAAGLWTDSMPANVGSYFGYIGMGQYLNGIVAGPHEPDQEDRLRRGQADPAGAAQHQLVPARRPRGRPDDHLPGDLHRRMVAGREGGRGDQRARRCGLRRHHLPCGRPEGRDGDRRGARLLHLRLSRRPDGAGAREVPDRGRMELGGGLYRHGADVLDGGTIDNFVRGGLADGFIKMSPLGPRRQRRRPRAVRGDEGRDHGGRLRRAQGAAQRQQGQPPPAAGEALVETDIALESMDYLVEGVIGSTS
jgi:basic membrane protein A and related proteins